MQFVIEEHILDVLEKAIKSRNCSFLVGAGISMIAPSSLPSGPSLKDFIIECLLDTPKFKHHYKQIQANPKYKNIVPEVLFQDLYSIIRQDIFIAYQLLENTTANHIHQLLGLLANKFQIKTFTTNFDLLIDQFVTGTTAVSHIHGSLSEQEKMAILIRQIILGVENSYKREFIHFTRGKNLFVFGYSGNDKDVLDLIKIAKPASTFWLIRDKNNNWVLNNILSLGLTDIYVFETELDKFFLQLEKRLTGVKLKHSKSVYFKKNYITKPQIKQIMQASVTDLKRFALLKLIYYRLQEYDMASSICRIQVMNQTTRRSHGDWLWFVINFCDSIIVTDGDLSKGHKWLNAALANKETKKYKQEFGILNNLKALFYVDAIRPQPIKALPYLKTARKTYERLLINEKHDYKINDIKDCLAKTYNNFGYAYYLMNRNTLAFEYYFKSLKLKKKIGDMFGLSTTIVNIAITNYKLKKMSKYYWWKKQAERFIDKYSQFYRKAYFYKEIGLLMNASGNSKGSRIKLEEALTCFETHVPSSKEIAAIKKILSKL